MSFITRFFAIIGFVVVVLTVGGVAVAMRFADKPPVEPDQVILTLDFDTPLSEHGGFSPLSLLHQEETPLIDILRAIDKAKEDPHVKGIVAHFGSTQPKLAEASEIRNSIASFRLSGKFTYAYAPTYGNFGEGNRAYYLASSFENIWLQPVGAVALTGLALQEPFGKAALDKIGVKADFMQREEYKSFMDMATRDDIAPPVKENMQALLDDLTRQIATDIAENRGWEYDHVRDLMARGPYTDEEAVKEKLVTRLGYYDELNDELDQKAGKDAKNVDVATYLSYGHPAKGGGEEKAKVAIIYGSGMIMDHDDNAASVTGDRVMGADTIAEAFDAAAETADVKAILFRIDSPGGTPEASETIRRAMVHAQKSGKPVFVSMGETAASGGYWIAMNADHIVAEPMTVTGSIGVLAGKFTAADLLQKLGITVSTLKTTEGAGMWSPTENFTPKQRERMNALLDNSYRTFTTYVATARHIPIEKMPDIAKGRVWTGAQAKEIGLVDELGGFGTALTGIRRKLNLTDTDQIGLEVYPAQETPLEKMMKLMKSLGMEEAALRPLLVLVPRLQAVMAGMPPQALSVRAPVSSSDIK